MKLQTLYKRTKTGAIQFWSIEVVETIDNSGWNIIKNSGQLGTTNPIVHKETISVGKQKRTVEEQAKFQAQSDWKKKHDEGYKSRQELNIEISGDLMHFSINHVHYDTLSEALNTVLPQFNTDASGNVKPMLATDWKKIKKIEYPVLLQPKLDGVRCLMIVNFEDKKCPIRFLSRSGKDYLSLGHIASDVIEWLTSTDNPFQAFILDGEVYSDELSFQDITSAVKAYKENSLKLRFRAYDIVNDKTQEYRWNDTVTLVDSIASPLIQLVSTLRIEKPEDVKYHHDDWVGRGYEGAMIRLLHGKYGQGQRSRELLKVKEFDETEFAFKNFEFGQRGVEDLVAVLWNATGDKEFRAKMIGSKSQKEELYLLNDESEGKSMTIKHFGYTDEGLPRFPVGKAFRDY